MATVGIRNLCTTNNAEIFEISRVNSSISLLIDFSSSVPLFLPCSLSFSLSFPSLPPLPSSLLLSLSIYLCIYLSLRLSLCLSLSFSSRLCLFDIPALPSDIRLSLFRDFTQNAYRLDRNSLSLCHASFSLPSTSFLPTLFLFYLRTLETAIFNRYKSPISPIYFFPQCHGCSTSSDGERASISSCTLALPRSTVVDRSAGTRSRRLFIHLGSLSAFYATCRRVVT